MAEQKAKVERWAGGPLVKSQRQRAAEAVSSFLHGHEDLHRPIHDLDEGFKIVDLVLAAVSTCEHGVPILACPQHQLSKRVSVPEGWDAEYEVEGGQPNGIGEIEENSNRDWFRSEHEDHHRQVITLTGPWEDGARPEVVEQRRRHEEWAERERRTREDEVLRQAEEIRARRERGE